jgi:5-methylcytosine-specific restriction endonuclease McrA
MAYKKPSQGTIEKVYSRAKGRCEHCYSKKRLEVHHIVTRGRGAHWEHLHDMINLALLCQKCHMEVHSNNDKDYDKWSKKPAPKHCTLCSGAWDADRVARSFTCIDCDYLWEF